MITHLQSVLSPAQLAEANQLLARADWRDGRITAGPQSAQVKHNRQVAQSCPLGRELGQIILAALQQTPKFLSAALPRHIFPPLFNQYQPGMAFGSHIDNALRHVAGTAYRMRTDLSATLFLSHPDSYDGGELVIEAGDSAHRVKLPAGDMVLYPATSVHHVTEVTAGCRTAAFFWVQSLVKNAEERAILYDMDQSIQHLTLTNPHADGLISLTGCYHNLIRRWAEV